MSRILKWVVKNRRSILQVIALVAASATPTSGDITSLDR